MKKYEDTERKMFTKKFRLIDFDFEVQQVRFFCVTI